MLAALIASTTAALSAFVRAVASLTGVKAGFDKVLVSAVVLATVVVAGAEGLFVSDSCVAVTTVPDAIGSANGSFHVPPALTFATSGPVGRVTVTVAPGTPVPVITVSSLSTGLMTGLAKAGRSVTSSLPEITSEEVSEYRTVAVPSSAITILAAFTSAFVLFAARRASFTAVFSLGVRAVASLTSVLLGTTGVFSIALLPV